MGYPLARFLLAPLGLAMACSYEVARSDPQTSPGRVVQTVYQPERYIPSVGMDADGNATITTNYIAPEYRVVIEWEHGQFEVRDERLWRALKRGDSVTVWYEIIWHIDKKTGARTFHDYDFVNAIANQAPRETP